MMKYTADDFHRAKSKMAAEVNKAITDAKELRDAAGELSGNDPAEPRPKAEEPSGSARERFAAASRPAIAKARDTAAAANHYVHASPWAAMGVAAAAGALIGFLVARR